MADLLPFDDRDGFIHVDGRLVPWREAKTHLLSHALHYSSCVFEGERAYGGRIFRSRAHSERLLRSAEAVFLPMDLDVEEIERAKAEVLEANGLTDAYVRAFAFRGSERMGVDLTGAGPAHFAVAAWADWVSYFDPAQKADGLHLVTVPTRRPPPNTIRVQSKAAGNYQISFCAKAEAHALGGHDALMLDWEGYVAESSGANIFLVKDGALVTPAADRFLNGITRQTVIGIARARGVSVDDTRRIEPAELFAADEVFLTGSAVEVTPVGRITHDGETHRYETGGLGLELAEAYANLVRGGDIPVTENMAP
jgi:branched-chain amino acid aminotransferase